MRLTADERAQLDGLARRDLESPRHEEVGDLYTTLDRPDDARRHYNIPRWGGKRLSA